MNVKFNDEMREQLVELYIEGTPVVDIARKLDVGRQTIYTWLDKKEVIADLERRRRQLANQGNAIILRNLGNYIENIKELADDKSDKRTCLAANQYLINRIMGNPNINLVAKEDGEGFDIVSKEELDKELDEFDNE